MPPSTVHNPTATTPLVQCYLLHIYVSYACGHTPCSCATTPPFHHSVVQTVSIQVQQQGGLPYIAGPTNMAPFKGQAQGGNYKVMPQQQQQMPQVCRRLLSESTSHSSGIKQSLLVQQSRGVASPHTTHFSLIHLHPTPSVPCRHPLTPLPPLTLAFQPPPPPLAGTCTVPVRTPDVLSACHGGSLSWSV